MSSADPAEFQWIDDRAGVQAVGRAMARAPWVALDTESNSMFVYRERVCLLQINAGGQLFIVDPLGEDDPRAFLEPLRASLERVDQPLLLHGGEYDVACMKREWGISLRGVFDTQQAAAFLGWPRTGYVSVVEAICGVKLTKAFAQHNWGRRPVDVKAVRYAIDDVIYLPPVAEQLRADIEAADLVEELQIANRAVMDAAPHGVTFKPEGVYRVKTRRELRSRDQPRLLALYVWRDELARQLDLPPGRLLNDRTMVAIVKQDPRDFSALRRLGLPGRLKPHTAQLLERLTRAREHPPPMPKRPVLVTPSRQQRRRSDALRRWRKQEAIRRDVPLQVVLPAAALEGLAGEGIHDLASVPQLGARRIARYGEALRGLIGEVEPESE